METRKAMFIPFSDGASLYNNISPYLSKFQHEKIKQYIQGWEGSFEAEQSGQEECKCREEITKNQDLIT